MSSSSPSPHAIFSQPQLTTSRLKNLAVKEETCRNFFFKKFSTSWIKVNYAIHVFLENLKPSERRRRLCCSSRATNIPSSLFFHGRRRGGGSFSARIRSPCEPPSARLGIRPFRGIPFTILERWIFLFECCASNIIFMKIMFSPLDTNPPSAECPDIMASRSRLLKNIHVASRFP